MTVTITELIIPTGPNDPAYADFEAVVSVRNAVVRDITGSDMLEATAAELLPAYQDTKYSPRRLFVVREDDRVFGRGYFGWTFEEGAMSGTVYGEVLPNHRGRGAGTLLAAHLERMAAEAGYGALQSEAYHTSVPGGERLASPTGFGDLPVADPGVRFLTRRGYRLEQINRISSLALPVDPVAIARSRADAQVVAGPDYRVVVWVGDTPDAWVVDIAHLYNRMSVDAPMGGMDYPEEQWDAERVRTAEARAQSDGRQLLTVAAEHIPSGRLAGFSVLIVPADRNRPVNQEETLVLSEHRGHRLGMLLKAANLQELATRFPDARLVVTGNAEENRYMLNVNEAIGFRPMASGAGWRRPPVG